MKYNIPTVNTSQAIQLIRDAMKVSGLGDSGEHSGLAIMLHGDAGCGKSYAAKAAADVEGAQYRALSAMHRDPTQVGGAQGLPMDDADRFLRHFWPEFVKGLDFDRPAVINIDEITKAPMATQNAFYSQLNERRADSLIWGKAWMPVMTGNLQSAKAGDLAMPSPLRNRCAQVIVKNTARDWLENYAIPSGLHYYVTSCVNTYAGDRELFRDGILNTWDPSDNPAAFASERAWDNLSHVCESDVDPKPFASMLMGETVGRIFAQHVDTLDAITDYDTLVSNPEAANVPDSVALCFAVGNMVSYWAKPEDMDALATYVRRLPNEAATACMSEVVKRHPECKESSAFVRFKCDYQLSIS